MAHPRRRRILRWALTLLFLGTLLLTAGIAATLIYGYSVAQDVERAFATYRWRLPSRIYSDRQPLHAGMHIGKQGVPAHLERMGYTPVERAPENPGEYRRTAGMLEIHQRPLRHPTFGHGARRLRITLNNGVILRIESERADRPEPLVYLEPELLGVFVGDAWQDRELVFAEDMPAAVTQAVVAIEDRRFFEHPGIDLRAIARALVRDVLAMRFKEGGSTLTQQLVKNIILKDPSKTLRRKYRELVMAYIIDREYSKEEILTKYLNEIYFGQNGPFEVRGIGSAARFYFGKPVEELNLHEAATLAGVIHRPNHYARDGNIDARAITQRRNLVLDAMYQVGFISEKELRQSKIASFKSRSRPPRRRLAPYFIDLLERRLQRDYSLDGLTQEGLSIHTSLQMHVQEITEEAVRRGVASLEQRHPRLRRSSPQQSLQAAAVVLRPATGEILALVGGRDYATTQYDRIHRAVRQPGSLVKPLIYLAALETPSDSPLFPEGGFGPLYPMDDTHQTFTYRGVDYEPRNYGGQTLGEVPAYVALARSLNIPAVDLFARLGPPRVAETFRRFGITTPLADVLPSALGASEVYPIEAARAFGALAAEGMQAEPRILASVADVDGTLLQHTEVRFQQAASPEAVAVLNSMLEQAVDRGTARAIRAAGLDIPVAGKTGTTNEGKDAWFVGYTPDLLALVWVGFDDGTAMGLTGSQAALPIWLDIFSALEHTGEPFSIPSGAEPHEVDVTGDGLHSVFCPEDAESAVLVFAADRHAPTCSVHWPSAAESPASVTPTSIHPAP